MTVMADIMKQKVLRDNGLLIFHIINMGLDEQYIAI